MSVPTSLTSSARGANTRNVTRLSARTSGDTNAGGGVPGPPCRPWARAVRVNGTDKTDDIDNTDNTQRAAISAPAIQIFVPRMDPPSNREDYGTNVLTRSPVFLTF